MHCPICNKIRDNADRLVTHIWVEHSWPSQSCPFCKTAINMRLTLTTATANDRLAEHLAGCPKYKLALMTKGM